MFAMFLELCSASEPGPLEKKLTGSLGRSKFPALSIMLTIIPREALQRLLRESLMRCHIRDSIWDETAEDRASWWFLVSSGVAAFEKRRVIENQQKRQKRIHRASSASEPGSTPSIPYPHCNRLFRAKIGLISHLRTHPKPWMIWSHSHPHKRRTNIIQW